MPELPEVQTTVDGVNATVKNLIITDVWTNYASPLKMHEGTIKNPSYFSLFKKTIRGARILHATRRAKNVLIHLSLPQGKPSEQTILVHMKMTGHLLYGKYKNNKGVWSAVDNIALADPFNRHVRLVFCFSNGHHLVLSDMRKFAKVTLIPTRDLASSPHLSTSGPEPLDKNFTEKVFKERLTLGKNKPVKTVLMDHTVVAGVGNIYSDEILWLVDTHPLTKTNTLSEKTLQKMFKAMRTLLRTGIDLGGDSMSDYRNIFGERGTFQKKHRAYQKDGLPCSKRGCTGILTKIKIGGRSAHFCPIHQTRA